MSPSHPLALALLAWSLSALLNLTVATTLLRWLRTDQRSLDLASLIFLFIFVTTGINMAAGLAGVMTWDVLGGLSLFLLLMILFLPPGRRLLTSGAGLLRDVGAGLPAWWESLQLWLRVLTVAGVIVSSLRFFLLIWALPPFIWDSLTYHLTNVAHWTQTGRIELFETSMHRIFTPANYEVFTSWFTVFLHHDVVVEAAGLPAYVLAVCAVYALTRQLNISRPSAWIAAISYGVVPGLLIAVTGTKNDPHMAAYYLFSLALVAFLAKPDAESSSQEKLNGAMMLILVLLLAAGTKAYIAHLIPGLVVFGLALHMSEDRAGRFLAGLREAVNSLKEGGRDRVVLLLTLLVVGVFLGGYWNVRNWILMGNPFYPYGVAIEGELVVSGADRTAMLTVQRLTANLRLLAARFGDHLEPIRPDLVYVTGWGWVSYVLGLPAMVWALIQIRRFRVLLLGFVTSFLFILLSIRPTPWNLRYAIWFPAVFAGAIGYWFDRLKTASVSVRRAFIALLVVTLGLNVATTLNYNRVDIGDFLHMLERSPWSRGAANLRLTVPAEYEFAVVNTPRDEVLGYNTHSNGFIYPWFRPDYRQRLVYVPFGPENTCEEIAGRMRSRGTRYLAVAPEHTPDRNILRLRACAEEGSVIRERARGLYILEDG